MKSQIAFTFLKTDFSQIKPIWVLYRVYIIMNICHFEKCAGT